MRRQARSASVAWTKSAINAKNINHSGILREPISKMTAAMPVMALRLGVQQK